jgi:ribosomal protein S26
MKTYEEQIVSIKTEVLVKTTCDMCGCEVPERKGYDVTTGHNDWHNDSHESVEDKNVCSDYCLTLIFEGYLKNSYTTKYIEIEKRH